MTPEQFERLANRLEQRAEAHPTLYRTQLILLAALGYAYILLLLVAALGLLGLLAVSVFVTRGGTIAIQLLVVLVIFVVAIVRALAVRIPPPEGIPLEPERVPQLAALVEELRAAVVAPPVDRIVVTADFNAALVMCPLWGYLGPSRSYLLLGLPLMNALGPQHFKAVLAHELGHLSGKHGRLGSWVYRVRQTWGRLHERLTSQDSHGRFLIEAFLNWFAPRFNAWSLVLARSQEYQADRYSAQATSPETAGEALIHGALREQIQDGIYWPEVLARARTESAPPAHAIQDLGAALREAVPLVPGERWLEMALNQPTVPIDTHPSLADRLRALPFPVPENPAAFPLPGVVEETAAQHFLGALEPEITAALDREWQAKAKTAWVQQRRKYGETCRRLANLEKKAARGRLSAQHTVERALLAATHGERERAFELLKAGLGEFPENGALHYALGDLMLEAGDASGVQELETAMHCDPEAVAPACSRIFAWYRERGNAESCDYWQDRARTLQKDADLAIRERAVIGPEDHFLPHNLPADRLEHTRTTLAGVQTLRAVYLVRKEVRHYPHKSLFLLAVVLPTNARRQTVERIMSNIARCDLPGDVFPIFLANTAEELPPGVLQIPDARVLPRPDPS